jgi:peptidoglycan hydrolase-like protein with peptidoglycan-binding domain
MKYGLLVLTVLGVLVLNLSGCATAGRNVTRENDNLKAQIQTLQTQLQEKSAEADSLRKALSSTTEQRYNAAKLAGSTDVIDRPSVKNVQAALNNAGYDCGTPDGRMGKKTRQAIKDFQKANGLEADGKVGKKTWAVLAPYLEQKNK